MKRFSSLLMLLVVCSCGTREQAISSSSLSLVRGADRSFAEFGVPRAYAATLSVSLPRLAHQALTVSALGDEQRSLSIRPLDLAAAVGRTVEAATVFKNVAPATDLYYAYDGSRVEEVRVLASAAAPTTFRWKIRGGRSVTQVQLMDGAVVAFDTHGRALIRSSRPFAVDSGGLHRDLSVSLSKGDDEYVLTASLDTRGLAYPIVVDPVWLGGPTMSQPRKQHVAAIDPSSGKVWIGCGGYNSWDVYDRASDTIVGRASAPTAVTKCAVSFTGGKMVVVGEGFAMSYNATANTWAPGKTSTNRLSAMTVVLADGRVLTAGGAVGTMMLASSEIYNPATDTWTTKASMTAPRQNGLAIRLASGKVLVAGGNISVTPIASAEIYDPVANTWTATGSMATAHQDGGIARVPSGKVVIAGGTDTGADKIAIYDPVAGTFSIGPTLLKPRALPGVAATLDGRVFVVGGNLMNEMFYESADIIDATLSTVSALPSMVAKRSGPTATTLADNRVLVTGGQSSFSNVNDSSELLSAFANGVACTWNGECASSRCVDGFCCAGTCGTCMRCDIATKEGTCNPSPSSASCGSAATCTTATLTPRGHCSGTDGTCIAPVDACAGALVCADATSCLTSCAKDADCTTSRCDAATGLCLPPGVDAGSPDTGPADTGPADTGSADAGSLDAGSADDTSTTETPAVAPVPEGPPKVLGSARSCTTASECSTGFCVDGVCCDSACKESCHSCALPGSPGRCSEEPLGVDLRNECGVASSCSRTCGKGGLCTTSTQGTQCAPSACTGASSGKGAAYCIGTGQPCPAADQVPFDCGPYICEKAFGSCRTSCTTSDQCSAGYVCDPNQKACVAVPPGDTSGCAISSPRSAGGGALFARGALFVMALGLARLARRRSQRG